MNAKNLAIVWAPNLLRSLEESLSGLVSSSPGASFDNGSRAGHLRDVAAQAVATEALIVYSEMVFTGDGDLPSEFPSSLCGIELGILTSDSPSKEVDIDNAIEKATCVVRERPNSIAVTEMSSLGGENEDAATSLSGFLQRERRRMPRRPRTAIVPPLERSRSSASALVATPPSSAAKKKASLPSPVTSQLGNLSAYLKQKLSFGTAVPTVADRSQRESSPTWRKIRRRSGSSVGSSEASKPRRLMHVSRRTLPRAPSNEAIIPLGLVRARADKGQKNAASELQSSLREGQGQPTLAGEGAANGLRRREIGRTATKLSSIKVRLFLICPLFKAP